MGGHLARKLGDYVPNLVKGRVLIAPNPGKKIGGGEFGWNMLGHPSLVWKIIRGKPVRLPEQMLRDFLLNGLSEEIIVRELQNFTAESSRALRGLNTTYIPPVDAPHTPTVIFAGEDDKMLQLRHCQELCVKLPSCSLHTLNAGHLMMLDEKWATQIAHTSCELAEEVLLLN